MLYAIMVSRREKNMNFPSMSRFGGFFKTSKNAKRTLVNSRFTDGYVTSVEGGDITFIKGFHNLGAITSRG